MKKESTRERKRLSGSIFAKIAAYFLLFISFLVGGVATVLTAGMAAGEVYSYGDSRLGLESMAYDMMYRTASLDVREFYDLKWPEEQEKLEAVLEDFCQGHNFQIEVWKTIVGDEEEAECILSNYDGYSTPYEYSRWFTEYEQNFEVDAELEEKDAVAVEEGVGIAPVIAETAEGQETEPVTPVMQEVMYEVKLYVNPEMSASDEYLVKYERAEVMWLQRYYFPIVALAGVFVCLCSFIFLMCGAGHKNGREGITPGVLTAIHFDVLTAGFGFVAVLGVALGVNLVSAFDDEVMTLMLLVIVGAVEVVWCTIYCAETALRLKLGQWWKHTLIYVVLRFFGRGIRSVGKGVTTLVTGLPLVVRTLVICGGICVVEFFLLVLWGSEDFAIIWIMEKLVLIPVVLYIALSCKWLQEGSKALAEGNLNHKLDTSKLVLDFKEHGENLNQIGQGISKAVEARMKSEHLKTELITNVSHDIKTPLTSIINYADLLGNAAGRDEQLSREKVAEYSEVLLRQSKRLKKLLEDMVEASKATTGNLDVNMEKCEVGVLLSQAVGEYEQRFWEKQLEVITRQPDEPVWILADGRRLWRVFDNLLNNICKYAQEGTRVYLTVAHKDEQVEIIFRNMSKYPLELTGEELEERFVRGDKSRHMEGNGLGLSIAKSLVELQNGRLEIVTDGDLFKVSLRFPVLNNG